MTCTSNSGSSTFTQEQLEDINVLLAKSEEEDTAGQSDSVAEPAAEPPSGDCHASDTSPSRWRQPGARSPSLDLSLLAQPDDEPSAETISEDHISCNSPTTSSCSDNCQARPSESPSICYASEPAS